ncbi:MAG: hypothetical protein R3D28_08020 [Geminicoccaceae bacterium]
MIVRRTSLARDRVRYVGQPYAVVIAETMAVARDAAERIEAEFSPLPALVDLERARDADAPLLHDEAPQNTRPSTSAWRRRGGRGGLPEGRARHAAANRQQPGDGRADGAARCGDRLP